MSFTRLLHMVISVSMISHIVHATIIGNPLSLQTEPYAQAHAQSVCSALPIRRPGWISAVPRSCYGRETCRAICSRVRNTAPDSQRRAAPFTTCLNSIHVYGRRKSITLNVPGLKTYKYNSCNIPYCGPNFCCCLSYR